MKACCLGCKDGAPSRDTKSALQNPPQSPFTKGGRFRIDFIIIPPFIKGGWGDFKRDELSHLKKPQPTRILCRDFGPSSGEH